MTNKKDVDENRKEKISTRVGLSHFSQPRLPCLVCQWLFCCCNCVLRQAKSERAAALRQVAHGSRIADLFSAHQQRADFTSTHLKQGRKATVSEKLAYAHFATQTWLKDRLVLESVLQFSRYY